METFDDVEKYICVICLELLKNPVTLPCKHIVCQNCLERTLDHNKYQCFLCRKFIGSWYRNMKRKNNLINENLKDEINQKFPHLVARRENGETLDIVPAACPISLSLPGEIQKDFLIELGKLRTEIEAEKEKEEKLSQTYIQRIKEEEDAVRQRENEIYKHDEQMAQELAFELNSHRDVDQDRIQLMEDEALARKLATDMDSPIPYVQHDFSPKINNLRKRPTKQRAILGPMDRFVGKNNETK